jgi:hypothetical protein
LKTEAARGLLRIIANYARLGTALVIGLVFMPFMFRWVGNDAVGLVGLLGAGGGAAAMFREITDRTVIRELGAAYHAHDDPLFRRVFNSALVVSTVGAGVVMLFFVGLYFAVPLLIRDNPGLHNAARVMVVTQGLYAMTMTGLAPIFNMQVVTERFVRYNIWMLADRATMLGSAVIARYVFGVTDPAHGIVVWAIIVVVLQFIVLAVPVCLLTLEDQRFRPHLSLARRETVGQLFSTFRWYVGVELSNNLYERAGYVLTAVFLKLHGTTVFYAASNFASYIQQSAQGVVQGLDAVSARLGSKGQQSLQNLIRHSTRLLALVALPTGMACCVLAPQLISLWLSRTVENPKQNIPLIATTVQILSLAITVRAIALGWTWILYGAGYLRRYAPLLLIGGICNPVIATAILLAAPDSWGEFKLFVIPAVLTIVYTTVHLVFLPRIAAQCVGVRYRDIFLPLKRPALATALCSPVILLAPTVLSRLGLSWNLFTLGAVGGLFGAAYAGVSTAIVLDQAERQRFLWNPMARLISQSGS